MSTWQTVALGDIAQPKQWPILAMAEMKPAGFPVYGANGRIGFTDRFTHEKPTILIGCRGSCGTVHVTEPRSYANGNAMALDSLDETRVAIGFLIYFLRRRGFRDVTTGTSQPQIIRQNLVRVQVALPPLPEQRRIVQVLDRAEALRAKRRAGLAQLDTLTQAIFLDMFGDPATNPKGWPRARLGDVIFSASDGPHVSPVYTKDGVPFLSTRHVRAGEITWEDLKFISHEDAEIHWRKCKPERGDILYTKGGTTGLAAMVRTDQPFAVWVHVALLKPNPDVVDSNWLQAMLNCEFCYRQSQALTHGIANRDLGLTRMVKIRMFLPPLSLQREFARRIAMVQKLKTTHRASLAEFDALFSSLQHRAFRGQL